MIVCLVLIVAVLAIFLPIILRPKCPRCGRKMKSTMIDYASCVYKCEHCGIYLI